MSLAAYLIQSVAYSALFAAIFRLLLSTLPAHRFNRGYLLAALVLPAVLPFIKLPVPVLAGAMPSLQLFSLKEISVSGKMQATGVSSLPGLGTALVAGYVFIAALLLSITGYRHLQLTLMLRWAPRFKHRGTAIKVISGFGPGSYNGQIFFPNAAADDRMLLHEQAHISQRHHYDLVLIQLVKACFWANPFNWYLAGQLKLVHEYEADALAADGSVHAYAEALLSQVLGVKQFSIAHAFFHHPIKNRIVMLHKKQLARTGTSFIKVLAMATLLLASATGIIAQTHKNVKRHPAQKKAAGEKVYHQVKDMPAFKGDVNNWLISHLQYPDAAREAGSEGRVIVGFIVAKDGAITQLKTVKSSNVPALDREALKVIREMPNWTPGKYHGRPVAVYFNLPITFKLEG